MNSVFSKMREGGTTTIEQDLQNLQIFNEPAGPTCCRKSSNCDITKFCDICGIAPQLSRANISLFYNFCALALATSDRTDAPRERKGNGSCGGSGPCRCREAAARQEGPAAEHLGGAAVRPAAGNRRRRGVSRVARRPRQVEAQARCRQPPALGEAREAPRQVGEVAARQAPGEEGEGSAGARREEEDRCSCRSRLSDVLDTVLPRHGGALLDASRRALRCAHGRDRPDVVRDEDALAPRRGSGWTRKGPARGRTARMLWPQARDRARGRESDRGQGSGPRQEEREAADRGQARNPAARRSSPRTGAPHQVQGVLREAVRGAEGSPEQVHGRREVLPRPRRRRIQRARSDREARRRADRTHPRGTA